MSHPLPWVGFQSDGYEIAKLRCRRCWWWTSHWEKPLHRTFAKGLRDSRLLSDFLPEAVHKAQVTGCPAGPRRYEHVTGDGWIAIGDAAFATDPLSGQGIEFAVDSASLAVRVLSQSWSPKDYEDAIHDYATNHEHLRALHLR